MNTLSPYHKAIVAFVLAAVGALAVAAVDNNIVLGEWMTALADAVVSGAAVFGVPNAPTRR